jgi:hypothetical protein
MKYSVPVVWSNTDTESDEMVNPNLVKEIDQAEPTNRVLDGSSDHGYAEEWACNAKLPDGRPCRKVWLFS